MDNVSDIRHSLWEARMEREGMRKCDACGWWGNDVEPLVVASGKGTSRTADLCSCCRREIA